MTETDDLIFTCRDLFNSLEAALPSLERLALEEKRGNIRRRAMGEPIKTDANDIWENAIAAITQAQSS